MSAACADYVSFATEVARNAGSILMGHYRKVSVQYKGRYDTVTAADRASERWIVNRIRSHFPRHAVVAEEGGGVGSDSEFTWYVDPLDGTTNFVHGLPRFCVSIGLWGRGEGLAGVVYDPFRDDLFAAESGSGAYLNRTRIRVSAEERFENGLYATGFPSTNRTVNPNFHYFHQVGMLTHGVRRTGSAALDLCSVACGHLDGFWEIGLKPWDVGAGLVVLAEAGGEFLDFKGGRYRPGDPTLVATNGCVTKDLLQLFGEIGRGELRAPVVPVGAPT